ncbi:MAG: hypothetical protein HHJ11_09540 [Phycicoccus sp.]|nr:hypothetical protein [Phycicoccus sp.]
MKKARWPQRSVRTHLAGLVGPFGVAVRVFSGGDARAAKGPLAIVEPYA